MLAMLGALAALALAPPVKEDGGGGRVLSVPTLAESFADQWAYVTSRELFNAVTCSRRAGKTHGAVDRHILIHASAPPGTWTHYGSLVRRNARKHFWRPLKKRLDDLGWSYDANEADMILRTERDTWIQAFSCPDTSGTAAVQGDGSLLFTIDECHLPKDDVLQALVEAAEPMLTDRGGMMDLLGLWPEVPGGFYAGALGWFDGEKDPDEDTDDAEETNKADEFAARGGGWKRWTWTMFDHDHPRPREAKLADVKERCRRRGLAIEVVETRGEDGRPRYTCGPGTHHLVARRYFGRPRKDPSKLAYEYQAGRNDYDPLTVDFERPTVRSSAGLDLGSIDHDAIVVQSWFTDDDARQLYSRFAWQFDKLDVDDLADVVTLAQMVYRAHWVGDTGGHGAVKVLKTLASRLRMGFTEKPTDVMMSVRLVNDDYRTGRLKHPTIDVETQRLLAALETRSDWDQRRKERVRTLLLTAKVGLTGEIGAVQKTYNPVTRKAEINKRGLHSDLSEANRYAHHAARHFRAKAAKVETREEKRDRQRRERARRISNPY